MNKLVFLLINLMVTTTVFAKNGIDVYGVDENKAKEIEKKYSVSMSPLIEQEMIIVKKANHTASDDLSMKKISQQKKQLLEKIKVDNDFLYVRDETVFYPATNNSYTTIEIIGKNEPYRLQFINDNNPVKKSSVKQDIINSMIDFSDLSTQLILNKQLEPRVQNCPVYHCSTSFDHPKLKPFLATFNQGAIVNKKLIIDTLNNDSAPERREAAALLIGHFKDPHEIITLLLPHVKDKNDGVRNSVVQVIFGTMSKAHSQDINSQPFIDLLDSPFATDRNAALCVLVLIAQSKLARPIIVQKAGQRLLALLQLKQPNNHDLAYRMLKQISGKQFGEHNHVAWQNWLTAAQHSQV